MFDEDWFVVASPEVLIQVEVGVDVGRRVFPAEEEKPFVNFVGPEGAAMDAGDLIGRLGEVGIELGHPAWAGNVELMVVETGVWKGSAVVLICINNW